MVGWHAYRDIATCERWKTADMLSDGTINVTVHHSAYLQNYVWNSATYLMHVVVADPRTGESSVSAAG